MEEMRGRIEIARDAEEEEEEEEEARRPHVDEQRRDDMYEGACLACEGDEKGVAWREGGDSIGSNGQSTRRPQDAKTVRVL